MHVYLFGKIINRAVEFSTALFFHDFITYPRTLVTLVVTG